MMGAEHGHAWHGIAYIHEHHDEHQLNEVIGHLVLHLSSYTSHSLPLLLPFACP